MKTILTFLLLGTAAPALAQTPPVPPTAPPPTTPLPGGPLRGGMMMRADANGDGIITREEALAEAGERFDRMDANHDGRIDRAEMDQLRAGRGRGPRGDMPPPPPQD